MIKNHDLRYLFRYTSIRLKWYKIDNVSINIYIRLCDCLLMEFVMNIRSQTEARSLSLQALNTVDLSLEGISGMEAVLKAICIQTKHEPSQVDIFNLSRLGRDACGDLIIMLSDQKERLKKAIDG